MKRFITLLLITVSMFGSNEIFAQTLDCNLFCITEISIDTNGAMLITMHNGNNTGANYPDITEVVALNGDTIASDTLFFFVHMANTTQTFTCATTLDSLPPNFTATIYYTYNSGETCIMQFPCASIGLDPLSNLAVDVAFYPNPVIAGQLMRWNSSSHFNELSITDINGKQLFITTLHKQEVTIPEMKTGVYFVNLKNNTKSIIKKIVIR